MMPTLVFNFGTMDVPFLSDTSVKEQALVVNVKHWPSKISVTREWLVRFVCLINL